MENIKEANGKKWPWWAVMMIWTLWIIGLVLFVQYEMGKWYERNSKMISRVDMAVADKPILHINQPKADALCPCLKPKARVDHKKAKPKTSVAKKEPIQSLQIAEMVSELTDTSASKKVADTVAESQKEDFYDKAVMPKTWVAEPEEEEVAPEPPRVGRKIPVIRQQPMMPYYGGYSSGYYPYAPQVTYGQPYIPPPQTVFVPAPPVIVPAPSVVTPAGGYKPQGSTGGHSPSGTTGTAL